jgi:transcription elongation factor GreA
MTAQTTFVTPEGLKKLEDELEYLRTERRREVAQRLRSVLDGQDVLENAEFEDAKNEQAFVEGRILTVETILKSTVLIQEGGPTDRVSIGSRVTIEEEGEEPETYHIIGSTEADPKSGRISNESPLGKALLGYRVGDEVTVKAPDGILSFRIIAIK